MAIARLSVLALSIALISCAAPHGAGDAAIVVAIGDTFSTVQSKSTLRLSDRGLANIGGTKHGAIFVTSPHTLTYRDDNLQLSIPRAGSKLSMPTDLGFGYDTVWKVGVSALPEYVTLRAAVAEAKRLLKAFEDQGFAFQSHEWARLAFVEYSRSAPERPRSADTFEEMEKRFLDPEYFAKECIVFKLTKGTLEAGLHLVNMRRKFPRTDDPLKHKPANVRATDEAARMTDQGRRTEQVYFLELSILTPITVERSQTSKGAQNGL